jgi:hypothetical protein
MLIRKDVIATDHVNIPRKPTQSKGADYCLLPTEQGSWENLCILFPRMLAADVPNANNRGSLRVAKLGSRSPSPRVYVHGSKDESPETVGDGEVLRRYVKASRIPPLILSGLRRSPTAGIAVPRVRKCTEARLSHRSAS